MNFGLVECIFRRTRSVAAHRRADRKLNSVKVRLGLVTEKIKVNAIWGRMKLFFFFFFDRMSSQHLTAKTTLNSYQTANLLNLIYIIIRSDYDI